MSAPGDAGTDAQRERRLAATRAWKATNVDHVRAYQRAWREANTERSRQLNRESRRRAEIRKKALLARRAKGRAWYAANREDERERARRFRLEHPEKAREYQLRFRERHPERAAEQGRRSSQKWRDGNADTVRELQREAATERREKDPDAYRRWYQANLEQQRERGREASRLRSRLKKLGLPPRKIQRVYANQRRANDRAAEAFFDRRRTGAEKQGLQREGRSESRAPTGAQLQARHRVMTSGELRSAAEELQHRLRAAKVRDLARMFFPEIEAGVARKHGDRLRQEVEEDSTARRLRGVAPYDIDHELRRRIREEAWRQAAAIVRRNPNEDQMRRRVNASFPAPLTGRAAATHAAVEARKAAPPSSARSPYPTGNDRDSRSAGRAVGLDADLA